MAKRGMVVLVVGLAALAATAPARLAAQSGTAAQITSGNGKMEAAHKVELRGTVKSIDLSTRKIEIEGEGGHVLPMVVGADVKNLDKLKVGDKVLVQYYQSLAFSL